MTSKINEHIYNLWNSFSYSIPNKVASNIQQGYRYVYPQINNTYSWLTSVCGSIANIYYESPSKNYNNHVRCTHNNEFDNDFETTIKKYKMITKEFCNSKYICIGNTDDLINLEKDKIKITIPIIFHLLDPKLALKNEEFWITHINKNIIAQLNNDFNTSYSNFSSTYISEVNSLFKNADPSKKNFYLDLVSTLPDNTNIQWEFKFNKLFIKSINEHNLDSGKINDIFDDTELEDPENYLNIVILPGNKILGISNFPFNDRDGMDSSKIDPKLKFRNAILINTSMFTGNMSRYDKFRTFTHEIGHWCGLMHPFDKLSNPVLETVNNDDGDNSTENSKEIVKELSQEQPTYGTVYDKITTVTKKINGNLQKFKIRNTPYSHIFEDNNETPIFYNFMDYTDDAQMCMFNKQQILIMVNMLAKFRSNFIKREKIID